MRGLAMNGAAWFALIALAVHLAAVAGCVLALRQLRREVRDDAWW